MVLTLEKLRKAKAELKRISEESMWPKPRPCDQCKIERERVTSPAPFFFWEGEMKASGYKQVYDDGFIKLERLFKTECCDCGLVHLWRLTKLKGVHGFRVNRDNRATGQRRRALVKTGRIEFGKRRSRRK